jgi:type I site-specific restriction endonuclease
MTPEALARILIDQLLQAAGWQVRDLKQANLKRAQVLRLATIKSCFQSKGS